MSAVMMPRFELIPMNEGDLDEVLAIEYRLCAFPWGRGNFTDSMPVSIVAGCAVWRVSWLLTVC